MVVYNLFYPKEVLSRILFCYCHWKHVQTNSWSSFEFRVAYIFESSLRSTRKNLNYSATAQTRRYLSINTVRENYTKYSHFLMGNFLFTLKFCLKIELANVFALRRHVWRIKPGLHRIFLGKSFCFFILFRRRRIFFKQINKQSFSWKRCDVNAPLEASWRKLTKTPSFGRSKIYKKLFFYTLTIAFISFSQKKLKRWRNIYFIVHKLLQRLDQLNLRSHNCL